jgi:response regulator RpfG family c-di-GMP phosphodiesterase
MPRPTFLVAEPEPAESISARKLVLETDKYNVITAYSGTEAVELFNLYPNVHAVVVHADSRGVSAESLIDHVKNANPDKPVIMLSPIEGFRVRRADHHCSSHDPQALLQLLRRLFPKEPAM